MTTPANSGPGYAERPDHKVEVRHYGGTVRAVYDGQVIAETSNALELREASYPPVYYVPAADVRLDLAQRSDAVTYCPFKGEASYWRFGAADDIAWGYETPYDEVAEIAGHIAFYPNKVAVSAG